MEDAIRTGRTRRGFATLLRVPPRGVPGFLQQWPLLSPLYSLLLGLFSLLFGNPVPEMAPPVAQRLDCAVFRRFNFRRPASLPSLASVTASSVALRLAAPSCRTGALGRWARHAFHVSRFTFHASRAHCNLSEKTDKSPLALPTANAFRSAYYITNPADHAKFSGHHFPCPDSLNSLALSMLPTLKPLWSLSVFVPTTSRSSRLSRSSRPTQTPCAQRLVTAGTLSNFVRKTGRMGGQTPFVPSSPDP